MAEQQIMSLADVRRQLPRLSSAAMRRVRFFVSYDTANDRRLATDLLDRLQRNFKASRNYVYDVWDESAIRVGKHRADAIAAAREQADFGLLLLSVSLFRLDLPRANPKSPSLETLLQEMLQQVWQTTQPPAFTAQDILRLVRDEGAILIFDGLDEKLVHLDETQGRAFLRTLWHALPPFAARPDPSPTRAGRRRPILTQSDSTRWPGRLIFSCRSHYFKTLRDQNVMLRGEDRLARGGFL